MSVMVTTLDPSRTSLHGRRVWKFACICAGAILAVVILDMAVSHAFAQNPFGGPRPAPSGGGLLGSLAAWILAKQSQFYQAMAATIRAAKTDGTATLTLIGLSFAYGIFHAAGPGHGKAVISSYLVANGETARRGAALSLASAMLQALTAVLIVGIAAWLLNATSRTMCNAQYVIESVSYALIAAMGARLVWTKGQGFFGTLSWWRQGGGHSRLHDHDHHHGHDHAHDRSRAHDHDHHHGDAPQAHCGHSHGPELSEIAGPGGWRRGLAAIFAVGLRPCSGALLVLVFALAQGLFWTGVAATFVMGLGTAITVASIATLAIGANAGLRRLISREAGFGSLAIRGIEFGAAWVVLLFGLALIAGYMVAERSACF